MSRNDDDARAQALDAVDAGRASPTPLFLGFLGALVLSAVVAFHGGFTLLAAADFLVLTAIITVTVMIIFVAAMIWAARAAQRAAVLAAARPGAVVLQAQRAPGLAQGLDALRAEVLVVPIGLTIVADDSGLEVWSGSAEQPLRLGRAPWQVIAEVRATRVTRWGRAGGGITVTLAGDPDAAPIELPFAVVGHGLGGLFAPSGPRLEALVDALELRRIAALTLV